MNWNHSMLEQQISLNNFSSNCVQIRWPGRAFCVHYLDSALFFTHKTTKCIFGPSQPFLLSINWMSFLWELKILRWNTILKTRDPNSRIFDFCDRGTESWTEHFSTESTKMLRQMWWVGKDMGSRKRRREKDEKSIITWRRGLRKWFRF